MMAGVIRQSASLVATGSHVRLSGLSTTETFAGKESQSSGKIIVPPVSAPLCGHNRITYDQVVPGLTFWVGVVLMSKRTPFSVHPGHHSSTEKTVNDDPASISRDRLFSHGQAQIDVPVLVSDFSVRVSSAGTRRAFPFCRSEVFVIVRFFCLKHVRAAS